MHSRRLQTGTEKLPISIWPAETYRHEPVHGWIHRAAARNYAYSTDTFIASLGLSGRDWNYDELLKIVRELPINEHDELEHNTPKHSGDGYELCGHMLALRFISKSERRVCPQCLDDQRYVRTWFDFVPLAACPYHNVALVGGLQSDPLDWRHTEIGWTRSGVKLGAEHAIPLTATELDHYIVSALIGTRSSEPAHLSGLSLNTILSASICLGKLFRSDGKQTQNTENVRNLCQLGFKPLVQGSAALIDFLCQAEWLQAGSHKGRYRSRLNGVPTMLLAIEDSNLRHMITEAFARARVRNGVTTPSGRLSKYDGESDLLNLKAAAKRLALSTNTLQVLLDKLSIKAKRCERTNVYRITYKQIGAIKQHFGETLNPIAASHLLGCEPHDLESLVRRKLLNSEFFVGGKRHYSRSSIDDLIRDLSEGFNTHINSQRESIDIFSKRLGISLAEASSRIIREKSLLVVENDPMRPVFCGLKVADAAMLTRDNRSEQNFSASIRPSAQVRDAITHAEAAARLGTSSTAIKKLIKASLITLENDARGRERISSRSLDRFEMRYVKACNYASALKCHPTSALKILRTAGVRPINDWKGAGPRFVDRGEVMRLARLDSPESTAMPSWHALQKLLAEHLVAHAVPATSRVTGTPGIEVRATSGRWNLLIEREQDNGRYTLTTNFLSDRQPRRLQKVLEASIDPTDIWPGATVYNAKQSGFVIVDEVTPFEQHGSDDVSLVNQTVVRSHQLHHLL